MTIPEFPFLIRNDLRHLMGIRLIDHRSCRGSKQTGSEITVIHAKYGSRHIILQSFPVPDCGIPFLLHKGL